MTFLFKLIFHTKESVLWKSLFLMTNCRKRKKERSILKRGTIGMVVTQPRKLCLLRRPILERQNIKSQHSMSADFFVILERVISQNHVVQVY